MTSITSFAQVLLMPFVVVTVLLTLVVILNYGVMFTVWFLEVLPIRW